MKGQSEKRLRRISNRTSPNISGDTGKRIDHIHKGINGFCIGESFNCFRWPHPGSNLFSRFEYRREGSRWTVSVAARCR